MYAWHSTGRTRLSRQIIQCLQLSNCATYFDGCGWTCQQHVFQSTLKAWNVTTSVCLCVCFHFISAERCRNPTSTYNLYNCSSTRFVQQQLKWFLHIDLILIWWGLSHDWKRITTWQFIKSLCILSIIVAMHFAQFAYCILIQEMTQRYNAPKPHAW